MEVGKRRLGGNGTEVGLDGEGLQELGGAHGFSEAIDATGMFGLSQPVEPFADVIALEKAVGGEVSAAGTVSASVGEQDGEMARQEEFGITEHAGAVIAEAMQENHSGVVRGRRGE